MSFAALAWVMDVAPCPTSQTFAALIVFANFANEDGRAYPSTETVAAKSRQNQKTVRAAIATLQLHGLLVDTGRRVGRTGNVRVYALGMEGLPKVGSLPGEVDPDAERTAQDGAGAVEREAVPETVGLGGGAKAPVSGSKPTRKRVAEPVRGTGTPEEAEASSAPVGAKKGAAAPGSEAVKGKADGWAVPTIADLPAEAQAIVRQWPAGAYDTLAAGHAAWLKGRRRIRDRDSSWHARIVQLGDQPIRAAKGGLRYAAAAVDSVPSAAAPSIARCDTSGEGEHAAALRATLRDAFGPAMYGQWFAPCRYDLAGDRLTVVAPKAVVRDWLRNHREGYLADAASLILGTRASVEWRLDATA
jgi:hypothetical protein